MRRGLASPGLANHPRRTGSTLRASTRRSGTTSSRIATPPADRLCTIPLLLGSGGRSPTGSQNRPGTRCAGSRSRNLCSRAAICLPGIPECRRSSGIDPDDRRSHLRVDPRAPARSVVTRTGRVAGSLRPDLAAGGHCLARLDEEPGATGGSRTRDPRRGSRGIGSLARLRRDHGMTVVVGPSLQSQQRTAPVRAFARQRPCDRAPRAASRR